jgi:hypothetical protein
MSVPVHIWMRDINEVHAIYEKLISTMADRIKKGEANMQRRMKKGSV